MIVVDPSAVGAIMTQEPGFERLAAALNEADSACISAAGLVELGMVLEGRTLGGGAGTAERFVRDMRVEVVALDEAQAERALEGWRRFGKGRHPAGLNLGDCFTYGLAATLGRPVLCVGTDFSRTDVEIVPLGG